MIRINIHNAKTNLSKYLARLKEEERIIICKHNVPIAEIVPVKEEEIRQKRPVGLAKGDFTVPDSFFDELPDEILSAFYPGE